MEATRKPMNKTLKEFGIAGVAVVLVGSVAVAWTRHEQHSPQSVAQRAAEKAALSKVMTETICRTNNGKARVKTTSGGTMDVQIGVGRDGLRPLENINVDGQLVGIESIAQNTELSGEKDATFKAGASTATKKLSPCPQ